MMEEDMQLICDRLLATLQVTRGGQNITDLIYAVEPFRETVTVVFKNGSRRKIDVTSDSGVAMIYELIRMF